MPRDLESAKATLDGMPPLSSESELSFSPPDDPSPLYRIPTMMLEERFRRLTDLHPYSLLLSQADLDDCDWLEHAAFDPNEAASREKIDYRLHVCGDLCAGLFSSGYHTSPGKVGDLVRSRNFPSVESADSDRKRILLGHIIATKHAGVLVTDPSMDFPKDWRTKYQLKSPSGVGHDEDGRTVCLHSLCVHPNFQGRGLGRVLLVGWTQKIRESGIADRISLICRDKYVAWYEKAEFKKLGPSKCQYGGGGWVDMVLDFGDSDQQEDPAW